MEHLTVRMPIWKRTGIYEQLLKKIRVQRDIEQAEVDDARVKFREAERLLEVQEAMSKTYGDKLNGIRTEHFLIALAGDYGQDCQGTAQQLLEKDAAIGLLEIAISVMDKRAGLQRERAAGDMDSVPTQDEARSRVFRGRESAAG